MYLAAVTKTYTHKPNKCTNVRSCLNNGSLYALQIDKQ